MFYCLKQHLSTILVSRSLNIRTLNLSTVVYAQMGEELFRIQFVNLLENKFEFPLSLFLSCIGKRTLYSTFLCHIKENGPVNVLFCFCFPKRVLAAVLESRALLVTSSLDPFPQTIVCCCCFLLLLGIYNPLRGI